MDEVYILRVGHKTFEPIRKNSSTFEKTYDDSYFIDAAEACSMHFSFAGYIIEDEKPVGIELRCDLGSGYGFDNGHKTIELRPGEKADFSYWGTCVDDEGDPEDYCVSYYFELFDWDDALLEL